MHGSAVENAIGEELHTLELLAPACRRVHRCIAQGMLQAFSFGEEDAGHEAVGPGDAVEAPLFVVARRLGTGKPATVRGAGLVVTATWRSRTAAASRAGALSETVRQPRNATIEKRRSARIFMLSSSPGSSRWP